MTLHLKSTCTAIAILTAISPALAQEDHSQHNMPSQDHSQMDHSQMDHSSMPGMKDGMHMLTEEQLKT